MNTLDALTLEERVLFREVIGRDDASLLNALERTESPTHAQREKVMTLLADEFGRHVSAPEWEPTPRGRAVDDLLGQFLLHFPLT